MYDTRKLNFYHARLNNPYRKRETFTWLVKKINLNLSVDFRAKNQNTRREFEIEGHATILNGCLLKRIVSFNLNSSFVYTRCLSGTTIRASAWTWQWGKKQRVTVVLSHRLYIVWTTYSTTSCHVMLCYVNYRGLVMKTTEAHLIYVRKILTICCIHGDLFHTRMLHGFV